MSKPNSEVVIQQLANERSQTEDITKILISLITNPVFDYIVGILAVEYLTSHKTINGNYFLSVPGGVVIEGALTSALVANALGGISGIGALLGVVK